jgi:hypothetical protein
MSSTANLSAEKYALTEILTKHIANTIQKCTTSTNIFSHVFLLQNITAEVIFYPRLFLIHL